ncbi:MAG: hypothetical protein ACO1NO_09900 [Burkholderiaceae bacterium]
MIEHQTFKTLRQQERDGLLAPLPHVRLRAQLALAEQDNAGDLMRTAFILIHRVRAYYDAVEYCAPRGDASRETPTAYAAMLTRYHSGLYREAINIAHHPEGPAAAWEKAGSMCLDTAFAVAEWEIGQHYPESCGILRAAFASAVNACKNRDFSGVYWKDARRRLGTKKLRSMLDTVLGNLQHAYYVIHPETGAPCFRAEQNFTWARKKLEEIAAEDGKQLQYARLPQAQFLRAA